MLAMLLLVYIFNFVDRQIISILAGPIKAELGLSDRQLGLLGGPAFALLYSTLAIPLAWIADRTSRVRVVGISLAVWSGFTALCGLTVGFTQLCLARIGVGVGEAGGVAPSYALIADYFPPAARARAISVYALGIPIGSAAGVLLGGTIASAVDWRTAFLVLGLAGMLLAPVFGLVVREPARPPAPATAPRFAETMRLLARKRSFWLLSLGAASASIIGYGLAFWLPQLFQRAFGLDLATTAQLIGALLLTGGVAGILLSGWLADRLGLRDRGIHARIPAIAFVVAVPLWAAGVMADTPVAAFLLFLVPQALVYSWLAPVISAVQALAPAPMRATASASFLLVNNLIGLGLGPFLLGWLSDALTPRFGDDTLRYVFLIGLGFYLLAAALLAAASRTLAADWEDDPPFALSLSKGRSL